MKSWMRELARHYQMIRATSRDEKLMIIFDIDGTILDMLRGWGVIFHKHDATYSS